MTSRSIRRIGLVGAVLVGLVVGLIAGTAGVGSGASSAPAAAASASSFNPGLLISDSVFYNSQAMTGAQVQAFIVAQGNASGCRANGSVACLKDLRVTNSAVAATAYCAAMPAGRNQTAGAVIAMIGRACGINPQVLTVLIEKEQGLVTTSTPYSYSYSYATGFACPDTTGCNPANSGFFNQLASAATQFQIYRAYPTAFNYVAGTYNQIQYNPNTGCGTQKVYIQNQATAGLYDYTPYVPNSAALANMYGTGNSCSSYGNRNFWRIFTDWFGNPSGPQLGCAGFDGCIKGWAFSSRLSRSDVSSSSAQSGTGYLALVPQSSGRTVTQSITAPVTVGDTYTASIWVKASSGKTARGRFFLTESGASGTEAALTSWTATSTSWQQVSVTMQASQLSHTKLQLKLELDSPGVHVYVDSASVQLQSPQPSRAQLPLQSPSFERGGTGWVFYGTGRHTAIYSGGAPGQGTKYLASGEKSGGYFRQDVKWTVGRATSFTATVWLRSATSTPYKGKLLLYGLGGAGNTGASTAFTVGSTWTPVQVTLPVTVLSETSLRLQINQYSPSPQVLYVDGASIHSNLLADGSFENNAAGWSPYEKTTNMVVTATGAGNRVPVDGQKMLIVNSSTSDGSVLVNVPRNIQVGEKYTASIWVRMDNVTDQPVQPAPSVSPGASAKPAPPPPTTATGLLALWELGSGGNANSSVAFTANGQWQQITVSRTILHPNTQLRLRVYLRTTNASILLDGAQLW